MGFAGEGDDTEMEDENLGEDIYEDHLSFEEMVKGIKQGKFF